MPGRRLQKDQKDQKDQKRQRLKGSWAEDLQGPFGLANWSFCPGGGGGQGTNWPIQKNNPRSDRPAGQFLIGRSAFAGGKRLDLFFSGGW